MIEVLERFHIDPERIRRERDAAASIGRAYLHTETFSGEAVDRELLQYAAATQLRRAGAHSLLLDDVKAARKLFHEAAKIYEASGAAYGSLLDHLGYAEPSPRRDREGGSVHASDAFYLWEATASGDRDSQMNTLLRRRLESYRADGIGILGLPAGIYLDIYDAVRHAEDVNRPAGLSAITEAVLPLLSAYDFAVRRARADRFHWERLATPFHPVEPDIVAFLVALHSAMKRLDTPVSTVIARIPLSEDTQSLLRESLRQYGAWRDQERTRFS